MNDLDAVLERKRALVLEGEWQRRVLKQERADLCARYQALQTHLPGNRWWWAGGAAVVGILIARRPEMVRWMPTLLKVVGTFTRRD